MASATTVDEPERTNEAGKKTADIAGRRRFPAGSWVVRMDQPYSRIADTLLDRQYWSPKDKYDTPYDDTGWSMGDLFDVQVARVTDATILAASMERVEGPIAVTQGPASSGVPDAGKTLSRPALTHPGLPPQTHGRWGAE